MTPARPRKDGAQACAPVARQGPEWRAWVRLFQNRSSRPTPPRDCHRNCYRTLEYELGWAGTALFPASEKRKPFQPIRHKAQRQHLA